MVNETKMAVNIARGAFALAGQVHVERNHFLLACPGIGSGGLHRLGAVAAIGIACVQLVWGVSTHDYSRRALMRMLAAWSKLISAVLITGS